MAEPFIKPPFFSWGAKPVASRGLGQSGDLSILRGRSVSTNDGNNKYIKVNSAAWFPFAVPDNYIPGDPIKVTFIGGLDTDDTFPSNVDSFVTVDLIAIGDGQNLPPHEPSNISATGYSWEPGIHWTLWGTDASDVWSGQGPHTSEFDVPGANIYDYHLIDGAGQNPNLPGEGVFVAPITGYGLPYGWYPNYLTGANEHPAGTYNIVPGARMECAFFFQTFPNDFANPDYSAYPFITGITVSISGRDISIPLTSVIVGFGPHPSVGFDTIQPVTDLWPPWPTPPPSNYNYGVPWTFKRAPSIALPPLSGGLPDDGYQDMYLFETGAHVCVENPVITGSSIVGDTLAVSNGSWLGSPTSYHYQWYYGDSIPIPGAIHNSWLITSAYVGDWIYCIVTARGPLKDGRAWSNIADTIQAAPSADYRITGDGDIRVTGDGDSRIIIP